MLLLWQFRGVIVRAYYVVVHKLLYGCGYTDIQPANYANIKAAWTLEVQHIQRLIIRRLEGSKSVSGIFFDCIKGTNILWLWCMLPFELDYYTKPAYHRTHQGLESDTEGSSEH